MISTALSVFVDGTALFLRHKKRKKILEQINERLKYHYRHSPIQPILYYPTTRNIQTIIKELKQKKSKSSIVVLDCKLELCNSEQELIELYNEAKRVSGANDFYDSQDLFILFIQRWSSQRINLDPKVRFVILEDPKLNRNLELKYKPFGIRKTVLADVRKSNVRNT